MQYFVKRGEKVQGPFSRERLVGFVKAKKISGSDFVATDKLGPFDPLKTIWHSITGIKGKSPIGTIQQPSPPQAQEPVVAAMPRPAAVPAPSNLSSANPNTRKKMTSQNPYNSGFQNPPPMPPQHQPNKFCATCGNSILMQAEICPKCGVRQPVRQGGFGSSNLDKGTAGLFALLLGGFGIHKFYLKEPVVGIIYILFCWTFIPAIIAMIEGIIYLTMSDQDFQHKYGHR